MEPTMTAGAAFLKATVYDIAGGSRTGSAVFHTENWETVAKNTIDLDRSPATATKIEIWETAIGHPTDARAAIGDAALTSSAISAATYTAAGSDLSTKKRKERPTIWL